MTAMTMPALRLAPATLSDLDYLCRFCRADEAAQWCADAGREVYDPDAAARTLARMNGPSWVLVAADGLPLIAAGLNTLRPGVAQVWAVGTQGAWDGHWHAITRLGRRLLRDAIAQGIHRLEVVSLASREHTHMWYERGLGLALEARMQRYFTDRSDAVLHVLVLED